MQAPEIKSKWIYVQATGEALQKGRTRVLNTFLLTMIRSRLADEFGKRLNVDLNGPGQAEVWISDLEDGRVEVSYQVEERGVYALHITYQGQAIRGSPFRLVVR